MKKVLLLLFVSAIFIVACNDKPAPKNAFEELSNAQSSILKSFKIADSLLNEGVVNVTVYDDFISDALAFYEKYPEEEIAPDMLNNAGNICLTLANYYKQLNDEGKYSDMAKYGNQAVTLYDLIIKVYPDYKYLNMVYLNKAIVYDEIFEDEASAELEYREFLHKFPNDPASASIGDLLKNGQAGKSAEEIFQSFQE